MNRKLVWALLVTVFASGTSEARRVEAPSSQRLNPLFACSAESSPETRLKCFDDAVSSLKRAVTARDVVVSDKAQINETRRTLFGLTLPRLAIFGGDDDMIDQVETTLDRAATDNYGHFTFMLADGSTWRQIDDNLIARQPRKGDKVVVKRAALGSFKLSVREQQAVRVKRQN